MRGAATLRQPRDGAASTRGRFRARGFDTDAAATPGVARTARLASAASGALRLADATNRATVGTNRTTVGGHVRLRPIVFVGVRDHFSVGDSRRLDFDLDRLDRRGGTSPRRLPLQPARRPRPAAPRRPRSRRCRSVASAARGFASTLAPGNTRIAPCRSRSMRSTPSFPAARSRSTTDEKPYLRSSKPSMD